MTPWSSRIAIAFSCVGHAYSHLFQPIFFVAALSLENELGWTHGEVVTLILAGNILYGVAAPVAGWVGDKWSSVGMIALFFLGTGAGMMLTGVASNAWQIGLFLTLTGIFASIYHPVGMAWLVRNAVNRGTALGLNGMFGSFGPSAAVLIAGALIDLWGWRAAFLVPGAAVVLTGVFFLWCIHRRIIIETKVDLRPIALPSRDEQVRAFFVLLVTLICSGLIYQATQSGMPKAFSLRADGLFDQGVLGITTLIAIVYGVAGVFQILAGKMADRYPLKYVYIAAWAFQVPFLWLAAEAGGPLLVFLMAMTVTGNTAALPAENTLVAKYAPSHWRGLVYGLKFILAFGLASLGVLLEGRLFDATGDYFWLFVVLGTLATTATTASLLLPGERPRVATAAAE